MISVISPAIVRDLSPDLRQGIWGFRVDPGDPSTTVSPVSAEVKNGVARGAVAIASALLRVASACDWAPIAVDELTIVAFLKREYGLAVSPAQAHEIMRLVGQFASITAWPMWGSNE